MHAAGAVLFAESESAGVAGRTVRFAPRALYFAQRMPACCLVVCSIVAYRVLHARALAWMRFLQLQRWWVPSRVGFDAVAVGRAVGYPARQASFLPLR